MQTSRWGSPSLWGRGLKPSGCAIYQFSAVALPVGAWIETFFSWLHVVAADVALPVGAWIETPTV